MYGFVVFNRRIILCFCHAVLNPHFSPAELDEFSLAELKLQIGLVLQHETKAEEK